MLKKYKFQISLIALITMVFVWSMVLDKFFPQYKNFFSSDEIESNKITVTKLKGTAQARFGSHSFALKEGEQITKPVTIITSSESLAILSYGKGMASRIKLEPNTIIDISTFKSNFGTTGGLSVHIEKGTSLFRIFNPSKKLILKVRTPKMRLGVRGTTFLVNADEEKSTLLVQEGKVEVDSSTGKVQMALAGSGFETSNENEFKTVNLSDYQVKWDFESVSESVSESNGARSSKNDLNSLLDELIQKSVSSYEEYKKEKSIKLQEIGQKQNALEVEVKKLEQDEKCLQAGLSDCEFISEQFKDDIANIKNRPMHLRFNPQIKARLEKEFEKAKQEHELKIDALNKEISNINSEDGKLSKDLVDIEIRFEKWKRASDPDEKNNLLFELDNLLNSEALHQAIQSSQEN